MLPRWWLEIPPGEDGFPYCLLHISCLYCRTDLKGPAFIHGLGYARSRFHDQHRGSAALSSSALRSRIDLVIAVVMTGASICHKLPMAVSRSALLVDKEETTVAAVGLAEPCDA